MPSSRGSPQPRDQTCVSYISCIGRQILYHVSLLGSLNHQWSNNQIVLQPSLYTAGTKRCCWSWPTLFRGRKGTPVLPHVPQKPLENPGAWRAEPTLAGEMRRYDEQGDGLGSHKAHGQETHSNQQQAASAFLEGPHPVCELTRVFPEGLSRDGLSSQGGQVHSFLSSPLPAASSGVWRSPESSVCPPSLSLGFRAAGGRAPGTHPPSAWASPAVKRAATCPAFLLLWAELCPPPPSFNSFVDVPTPRSFRMAMHLQTGPLRR